jgi:hypothetical protein
MKSSRPKKDELVEGRQRAEIQNIAGALTWWGSGRPEIPEEERKATVADFKKWLLVCQKLKKNLSSLRQNPDWTSRQFRNKAIDMLAEKHFFSRSEVAEIEDLPPTLTPWRMTMRLVARKHRDANGFMMGEKTVEEIYRDWLKEHPESRMKKTKISTTPVAERTA